MGYNIVGRDKVMMYKLKLYIDTSVLRYKPIEISTPQEVG